MLAAITRASTLLERSEPTGPHDPVLQHAQQLGLKLQRHLADLVEEDRAAVGRAEQPVRGPAAPVKAPRSWPNISDSSSSCGIAAQLTGTKARPRRADRRMDRLRDDLLAGAALAGDQHGRVGGGDALDQRTQLDDRRMFADEAALER